MRVSTTAAAVAALAIVASAKPVVKRATLTDTDILQYALTLEHLENNFYSNALAKMDAAAFEAAGFEPWVRNRFMEIAEHEASHVALLAGALGAAAVQPCNYSFPYTDPVSFAGLAQIIENVGVSAYLGAAQYISTPAYVTVAGSILTTEARHQAWLSSAVNKQAAWSGPYDTPATPSVIYSAAAGFITGCPASNAALPVVAFPTLSQTGASTAGGEVSLTYTSKGDGEYLIVYSGLTIVAVPITSGMATLPAGLQGIFYLTVASTSNTTALDDSNIVAGPAAVNLPFLSSESNPGFTGM